jgi:hypothetical protein
VQRLAGRLPEALECVEAALAIGLPERPPVGPAPTAPERAPWWLGPVDVPASRTPRPRLDRTPVSAPWTEERLLSERAHLLRRLGRFDAAADAWLAVAAGPGRIGVLAWIEVAKIRERRLGDVAGALEATERARAGLERRRRLGLFEPRLENEIGARIARLRRRAARAG